MAEELVTRFIGFCAICERDIKLHENLLVHHGYRRPGDGMIHGDCVCVGREPYELSCVPCEERRDSFVQRLESLKEYLAKLEAGLVTQLSELQTEYKGFGERKLWIEYFHIGVTELYLFKERTEHSISEVKRDINGAASEIARMEQYIKNWVLKPVRTVEEVAEREASIKAAKKAERDKEKAERKAKQDEKKAALQRKKDAWEAEKAALMAKYKDLFERLSKGVESLQDRKECARIHWVDMCKAKSKKAYLDFYPNELECTEALISLGLARREDRGNGREWIQYASYTSGILSFHV